MATLFDVSCRRESVVQLTTTLVTLAMKDAQQVFQVVDPQEFVTSRRTQCQRVDRNLFAVKADESLRFRCYYTYKIPMLDIFRLRVNWFTRVIFFIKWILSYDKF